MVRFLSIIGGLLTLASLVLHNANDLNRNYELSPRGRTVIQYGWPFHAATGWTDASLDATLRLPSNYWRATNDLEVAWVALVANVGIAILLSLTTYWFLYNLFLLLRIRINMLGVFGLMMFFAFAFEENIWTFRYTPKSAYPMLIETWTRDLTSNVVWLSVFVATIWLPVRPVLRGCGHSIEQG